MKVHYPRIRDMQAKKEEKLSSMLRDYYLEGCAISLEGREVQPWQAVDSCLREPVSYMMDFIPDPEGGRIRHIDFVRLGMKPSDTLQERYEGWCS